MRTVTVSSRARAVDIGSSSSFGSLVPVLLARAGIRDYKHIRPREPRR
jgi:hypothetical protein